MYQSVFVAFSYIAIFSVQYNIVADLTVLSRTYTAVQLRGFTVTV